MDQFSDPAHLRAVLETMLDGLLIVDHRGIVRVFNPACEGLFGHAAADVIGRNVKMLVPAPHRARHDGYLKRFHEKGEPEILGKEREVSAVRKDGSVFPLTLTLGRAEVDGASFYIAVMRDLTPEKALREAASTDALTGVLNRRTLLARGREEIGRAARYGRPFSVLMLDIDHFKRVNDTHGHATGDEALRRFADACQAKLRDSDAMGRVGGEEFAIVLPETDAAGAKKLAERLRRAVSEIRVPADKGEFGFTVSIGVAKWAGADDSMDHVLERADRALYQAKQAGRDRVEIAD